MWQKIKKWFTIDHVVDLFVDLMLLIWDVITSPVLIIARVIRNIFGDYITDKLKKGIKWLVHFYVERCNKFWKIILGIIFFIITPIVLLIVFGVAEGLQEVFTEIESEIN